MFTKLITLTALLILTGCPDDNKSASAAAVADPTSPGKEKETATASTSSSSSSGSSSSTSTSSSASLVASSSTLAYGNVLLGTTSTKTVTIKNSGLAKATALSLSGLSLPFSKTNACGSELAAGASCDITVAFNPTSSSSYSATLALAYNNGISSSLTLADATNATVSVAVTGQVAAASLSLSESSYDFWRKQVNTTSTHQVTITNNGTYAASSFEFGLDTPFNTSNDCPASLAPSESCTVTISYQPTTEASHSAQLAIDYNDGNGAAQKTYAVTGIGLIKKAQKVATFLNTTCIIYNLGDAKCWGSDAYGNLGDDSTIADKATPQTVSGLSTATDISGSAYASGGGYAQVCSIDDSTNALKCWGKLDGTNVTATPVSMGTTANSLPKSTAENFYCVVVAGQVKCMGRNDYGQIGIGAGVYSSTFQTSFSTVNNLSGVTQLAIGGGHACAVLSDGKVKCWGYTWLPTTPTRTYVPDYIFDDAANAIMTDVAEVAVSNDFNCVRKNSGNVLCWGNDVNGQVGDGASASSSQAGEGQETGITTATSIATGQSHACAVLSGGTVKCWGNNASGQLGTGDNVSATSPVSVSGITNAASIYAGANHTCALLTTGAVKCWGDDTAGQLGDDASIANKNAPVAVSL